MKLVASQIGHQKNYLPKSIYNNTLHLDGYGDVFDLKIFDIRKNTLSFL